MADLTTFAYTANGLVSRITLPDASYLDDAYVAAHRRTRVTASTGARFDRALDAV